MFKLHPQLQKDLIKVGKLSLSQVFILPNSENPWLVLVPEIAEISEWHKLSVDEQIQLTREISFMSQVLEAHFKPDKINIGSLGNMVPQLHVHIIARYKKDKAWPGALWGVGLEKDDLKIKNWLELIKIKINESEF